MGKRKHIGIIFSYNEGWIGGTYYILNLIHSLNTLSEEKKPWVSVICTKKKDYDYIRFETQYPYLHFIKYQNPHTLWAKAINAFSLRIFNTKWINPKLSDDFDIVFPNPTDTFFSNVPDCKKNYWIPDFQEHYYPNLFSVDEMIEIKQRQIEYVYRAKKITFSSNDTAEDFKKLYPQSKAKIYIMPFSVSHPQFSDIDFSSIALQLKIQSPYFYIPNQFWVHKNHSLVIRAVKKLKAKDPNILVVFSGKEKDHRAPDYIEKLKEYVKSEKLEANIKFLGFLERKVQLCILQNAKAIIQPSLFEGWSTVIEDAKALKKPIIASNINVHVEQLNTYNDKIFFESQSEDSLIEVIINLKTFQPLENYEYELDRVRHAIVFLSTI